jgi:hypothetical protein
MQGYYRSACQQHSSHRVPGADEVPEYGTVCGLGHRDIGPSVRKENRSPVCEGSVGRIGSYRSDPVVVFHGWDAGLYIDA